MTHGTPEGLARMRREYAGQLTEAELAPTWPAQFGLWLADAVTAAVPEPNAMVLATADERGRPSARNVLLKGYGERGFVFYTNHGSRKAHDLAANPQASAVFGWLPLHRQVIVCGAVRRLSRAETQEYFDVRPRDAQLGAWASPQSTVLASRAELESAFAAAARRFDGTDAVPAPPHWGGYLIIPETVEFWQGRPSRLHDRLRFRRVPQAADGGADADGWIIERLAP